MSSYRARDIDRRTAEHLLAGRPAGHATRPLAAALRAAAAPAHPEELSGERAAMTAFAAAQLAPVPEPRRPSMLKSALAKILTVKAAIVLAAAAGTGGVVLASTSGALPTPWTDTPADPPAVSKTQDPSSGKPADAGKPAEPGKDPSPSMAGLCNAYEAKVKENPGKALESPAFSALVDAAGGKDGVDEYCDAVAAGKEPGKSGETHGKPSDLPTPDNPGNGAENGSDNGNGGNGSGGKPDDIPADPSGRAQTPGSPEIGNPTAVPQAATPPSRSPGADPDRVGRDCGSPA